MKYGTFKYGVGMPYGILRTIGLILKTRLIRLTDVVVPRQSFFKIKNYTRHDLDIEVWV